MKLTDLTIPPSLSILSEGAVYLTTPCHTTLCTFITVHTLFNPCHAVCCVSKVVGYIFEADSNAMRQGWLGGRGEA